jgi:hypothetical protein
MNDRAFEPVAGAFRASHLYGVWRSVTEGFASASRDSTLLLPVRSLASAFTQWSAAQKVSFTATTIGVASIALVAIRAALPAYASSGLPWWWNVTVAAFAFGIAIASDAGAVAWMDSTPARIWRRLTA